MITYDTLLETIINYMRSNQAPLPLDQAFIDVLKENNRLRFFNDQSLISLSKTNKTGRHFFLSEAAERLLKHVLRGKEEQTLAMIQAQPQLLLIESQARDYSGRMIQGTAFQAALGAEDCCMWRKMMVYFNQLEDQNVIHSSKEEMLVQFNKQFPNGLKTEKQRIKEYDELKMYYDRLARQLANASDSLEKQNAMNLFRNKINTHSQTITTGKHFNMQHLEAAYKTYSEIFIQFNISPHSELWEKEVLGYILSQIPCFYAQVHCSGIFSVADDALSFERKLNYNDDRRFYPLQDEDSELHYILDASSSDLTNNLRKSGMSPGLQWVTETQWRNHLSIGLKKIYDSNIDQLNWLNTHLTQQSNKPSTGNGNKHR